MFKTLSLDWVWILKLLQRKQSCDRHGSGLGTAVARKADVAGMESFWRTSFQNWGLWVSGPSVGHAEATKGQIRGGGIMDMQLLTMSREVRWKVVSGQPWKGQDLELDLRVCEKPRKIRGAPLPVSFPLGPKLSLSGSYDRSFFPHSFSTFFFTHSAFLSH